MATTIGTEYDHIDITNGVQTIRHPLKDASARENLVKVQDTQPESNDNVVWVKETPENEVQVPTYDEFSDLKSALEGTRDFITKVAYAEAMNARILFGDLGYYSLNSNGELVEQSNKTRLATISYYKFDREVFIRSTDVVSMIVCTYDENHVLLTRTSNILEYAMPANTIFRVCIYKSTSTFDSVFVDNLYIQLQQKTLSKNLVQYDYMDKILFDSFAFANLDVNGDLVSYNSGLRLATPDYYSFSEQIIVDSERQSILCLYASDYTLISRTTGSHFEIPANTLFRVCVISNIAYTESFTDEIYISSKKGAEIKEIQQELQQIVGANNSLSLISCFHKFVGIGDSLMAGFTSIGGTVENSAMGVSTKNNWFDYLLTRINRTGVNLAHGSSTIHNWRYGDQAGQTTNITEAENIETDCYFVGLGVNDVGKSLPIGSTSDIKTDMEQNADTVYGNLNYILRKLKGYNPYAKIFVFTIPWRDTTDYTNINTAITNVCSQLDNVYCIELPTELYDVDFITNNYTGGHFNPITYNYMSTIIENLVNKYIYDNYTNFVWIPYHH